MDKFIRGMTIIEVLVSLTIISITVLGMLSSAAWATRRATISKLKTQMIDAGVYILEEFKTALNTTYDQQDWDDILNTFMLITQDENGVQIHQSDPSCYIQDNTLTVKCPTLSTILPTSNLPDGMRYVIRTTPVTTGGIDNIYEVRIFIGCSNDDNYKCNPDVYNIVTIRGYVVQF